MVKKTLSILVSILKYFYSSIRLSSNQITPPIINQPHILARLFELSLKKETASYMLNVKIFVVSYFRVGIEE